MYKIATGGHRRRDHFAIHHPPKKDVTAYDTAATSRARQAAGKAEEGEEGMKMIGSVVPPERLPAVRQSDTD
jgi:hypothetical protein